MKDMLNNVTKYRAVAEVALENSAKALAEGDLEASNAHKAEAQSAIDTAKAWQGQYDSAQEVAGLAPVTTAPVANTLPHTADNGDEVTKSAGEIAAGNEDAPVDVVASVNVLRYGDQSAAVKAVTTDMYGKDYMQQRHSQQSAFNRYLKGGRLNGREEEALQNILYTPDLIAAEVKMGFSVDEIMTNKAVQQSSALEMGGYLVPEDFRTEITKRIAEPAIVRSKARVMSTTRDAVEWTTLTGGDSRRTSAVQVSWVDEVNEADIETNFTLGTIRIPVHTVMAQINVSRNLLEDSVTPVPAMINEQFAEALALEEDKKFLLGQGNGSPQGILSARESGLYAPGEGIGYVYSGHASQLTVDGLVDLVYEADAQYWAGMQIVGNKESFRDVRKMKTTDGQLLWQPGLQAGDPPQILSYPWSMTTLMDGVAAGSYPLLIGDFKGYCVVDRVGMTIERVADSTTIKGNQVAFFLRRRTGGQVVEPWRFKALKVGVEP